MHLSRLLLDFLGWKVIGTLPEGYKKLVVVSAPHTSMWDYVIGRLYFFSIGIKPAILMKKEMFFFPLGILLKYLGGIPVDRSRNSHLISDLSEIIKKSDQFYLVLTPEGTRKRVAAWKTGFYFIAREANIPVLPGYFDYATKTIGIGNCFFTSDDIGEDIRKIKEFVKNAVPRHPDLYDAQ